ncbi:hypothetical protein F441_18090 [Phytophthora nicotianae CJ01A1]|uniref:PiggyBac transposable element-derived protein domain-containing protein n=1 Tax=Phytophthora nicotianae CJ01A1 TaxID=1317063 RepID=W2W3Z5_PHYNI|nr:hypothetical protein F441_18090 [Phytophthora nicotianae CJ01A1]
MPEFAQMIKQHTPRLSKTLDATEIHQISKEFVKLQRCCEREDELGQVIRAADDNYTSFDQAWAVVGAEFPALMQFCGDLASTFPNTSTVESDFSIMGWEKDTYRRSLSNFSQEGILQAKHSQEENKDRLEAETSTKKSPVKKRISKAQRATLAREEKKTKAAQTIARAAVVVARRANEKARGRARVAEVERSPASSTEILAVPQTRRQPARSLTMSTANPDSSSAVTTGASIQNRDDGALNSDLEGGGDSDDWCIEDEGLYPGLYRGGYGPTEAVLEAVDSPLSLFFFFTPRRLWRRIATESNRYHQHLNERETKKHMKITPEDVVHCIGLLIARMLCPHKRRFAEHWATKPVGAVPKGTFGSYKGKSRFECIMQNLHFTVNTDARAETDRVWKVRSVVDTLQHTFARGYNVPPVLSFDEAMIPSRSRHNETRQLMKDKPHNWGTKLFMTCCATTAYCLRHL